MTEEPNIMISITYVSSAGQARTVAAEDGSTVMQTALDQGVPGIVAECGGSAMCATCHVYVDPAWADRLPPINETEDAMLESAGAERKASSRLSCQLPVTVALDGLIVHVPATQG
jgi:ferredoxin, 2Fe-2S